MLERNNFSLAHLSDLHVGPRSRPPLRALAGKRVFGLLAWWARRRAVHRPEILAALVDDLRRARPDHVAITGDLTTLALPEEFEAAAAELRAFGASERVSVVPGNHDALVRVPWAASLGCWSAWMTTDDARGESGPVRSFADFPFVRRRSFVALVGLSSAVPTPLFLAQGGLGAEQLTRLEAELAELAGAGLFRVVLLHHSPIDGISHRRRCLTDAAELRATIRRAGAELILHGHEHRPDEGTIAGRDGPVPVLGVPSASALPDPRRSDQGARYYLINVERRTSGWRVTVGTRRFDLAAARFVPASVRRFDLRRRHRVAAQAAVLP